MFDKKHWTEICQRVANEAQIVLPRVKHTKDKSTLISSIFEIQAEKYFNENGIHVKGCQTDREPDLIFPNTGPCEIKVTSVQKTEVKSCKWMGGQFSKRTSDFLLITWNSTKTLWGNTYFFSITHCYIDKNEWQSLDNGNNSFYGTGFDFNMLRNRKHNVIVGTETKDKFIMESFNCG
jgi:hypothetical protein